MANFLEILVPTASLKRWYALEELDWVDGGGVTYLQDSSGIGATATAPGDEPIWVDPAINSRPAVNLTNSDGFSDAPSASPSYTLKTLWIVSKADGAAFTNEKDLVQGVLRSSSSGTKFKDLGPVGLSYQLNGTTYASSNMQAPFGSFGVSTFATTTGVSITDTIFGDYAGQFASAMFFSDILTAPQQRKLRLYHNLKFAIFKTAPSFTFEFPSPDLVGIDWARYREVPRDWSTVTITHTYEDESKTFSDTSDTPPQFWEVGYTGLTKEEAEMFDAFWEAARLKNTFRFTDADGTIHEGVRCASYDRDHDANKSWSNSVNFRLVKYY